MRCSSVPGTTMTSWPGSVRGFGCSCASAVGTRVRDVLDQRAAEHDVEQLLPAADAEHRHVALDGTLGDRPLEPGAPLLGLDRRVPLGGAVEGGIDVEGAAGDDEAVDHARDRSDELGLVRQRDRQAPAAASASK